MKLENKKGFIELLAIVFLGVVVLAIGGFSMMLGLGTYNLNDGGLGGETDIGATTACGATKPSLLEGFDILPTLNGKLGNEEHLSVKTGGHYCGADSGDDCDPIGSGAFAPRNTEQEKYYFNTLWGSFDWEPTRHENSPIPINTQEAKRALELIPHSKLIITKTEPNGEKKSIVVSAEESGPALWVAERDGIWYGAPPEVHSYLKTEDPYTRDPTDDKGRVTVGFAVDQNIKLGPCL